ncbi:MAG: tagaturonate epimerase family protein [Treponema sp.]|nr:tagaturonate epimerase family protein [Treponema sp.]
MQYLGYEAFEKSINNVGTSVVFMAKDNDETVIIISGPDSLGFKAEDLGVEDDNRKFKAKLTHDNACVLRKLFPFTAPVRVLGKPKSFGLGDRLGIATPGHIDLFKDKDAYPVFAQQSIRELTLTNRTYEDVLNCATFAVYREGYKKGFGADGDHLKTAKDVEYALSLGFTMITLDCSEHIKNDITSANAPPVPEKYKGKYLNKTFNIEGISIEFSEDELKQCAAIYEGAIIHATEIYKQFFASGKYDADFEISIDETVSVTTPLQHFFVARELLDAGVSFATVAPRFCGEFQKGIDYIGDIAQFEKEIKVHAAIARHLGYKLSIHSGSDKFSVFPIIGRETKGKWHVKTAGTNWLEAMRVVAITDPALYREVHSYALGAFDEARKYYHVTTDMAKLPDLKTVKDEDLPKLFENNEVRQVIHITYGLILSLKNSSGSFVYKDRLYKLWSEHEGEYRKALLKHIGKHLDLLN